MKYEENLSGWAKAIEENRISLNVEPLKEDRLSELRGLIQSGLPTFDYHFFKLSTFLSDENSVKKIYRQYEGHVVVRVIPTDIRFQRITIIDKSLEACYQLLEKKIEKHAISHYNVVINEYDPAKYAGIVISSPERLIIEMVDDVDLERLSHGHVVPWLAEFAEHFPYSFRKMIYYGNIDDEIKKIMWFIVKYFCSVEYDDNSIPKFIPRVGDFEFVISKKTGTLRFVDYNNIKWKLFRS